jgi:radical SAM protein with 4Fe4S-binding SPASM domain
LEPNLQSAEVQLALSTPFPKDLTTHSDQFGFARDWHKKFPPMIVVSITNVCNQKCIHCFSKDLMKMEGYVKSFLPFEIWEKMCEETSHWPGVIMNFGTDGEPLLHPRILDMLRVARGHQISPINITTNGTRLTTNFVDAILSENLVDVMNISLDAFTAETYRKIRQYDYAPVAKKVHEFIEKRNAKKSHLKIQVNIIDQPEAHEEIESFKQYWSPLVDNVMIRTYYDATSVTGETGGNVTGRQSQFPQVKRWPCQMFWRRLNVGDDGTVRYCTDDWFNKTKVGDLRSQTIAEVWTGEAYNKFRHIHLMREFHKNSYCAKCTEWQGMTWDYDYFTAMEKMLDKKFV